jgi:dimethylargininase
MQVKELSFRFTHAVTRRPGRSVTRGLRASDRGSPDFDRFLREHGDYVRALERAGLSVTVLDAQDEYPDSVFIEDAALCLPHGTVMLRPGAPSRTGEPGPLAAALASLGHEVLPCDSEGFIDGGDILVTDSSILVGLSSRTDRVGFEWLRDVLAAWGYHAIEVHTPENVLHFKSDCCLLDGETILATSRLSKADCFAPFRVLTVPPGEEAAANSIRVNETVLIPAGYPRTNDLLVREGYTLNVLRVTQAALLDGGLSCMSLRLSDGPVSA